jgi:hypothetical protein
MEKEVELSYPFVLGWMYKDGLNISRIFGVRPHDLSAQF